MINLMKLFFRASKHPVNPILSLLLCCAFAAFLSCASDPNESDGLFSDVYQVNLDNIPNRSDLRISDIAFDLAGRIYVCSRKGQVFSISKNIVKEIKPNVTEENTPWMPRAVSTDHSDKLYIAGLNHVWIFDASGESLGGFETDIPHPTSIAIADDGMVYIAGHNKGYVLHQYAKNGIGKPVLEELTKGSQRKIGTGQFVIQIDPTKEPQNQKLQIVNTSSAGMVRAWKNGVVFADKTSYHLIAYQDGQVVTKRQRPELDFEPRSNTNISGNNVQIQVQDTGKGIGVTVTDEFVFYCYSLPKSEIYIDIYDHNLNPVEIDVGIDGTLIGSDKEGYLYLKRKVDGREELFRAKFNPQSLRKSQ